MIRDHPERSTMNPVALVCDVIGLPQVLEKIPSISDIAKEVGLPTPAELINPILDNAKAKIQSIRRP